MSFNFLNSRQVEERIHFNQEQMYWDVYKRANKSQWIRLAAPLVALGSSLLKVVQRICSVAETVLKGICNLLAFPFTNKCKFSVGLDQLFVKLPMDIIALILTPLHVAVGSVITTGGILFNPESYAYKRSDVHEAACEMLEDYEDGDNLSMYSWFFKDIFG